MEAAGLHLNPSASACNHASVSNRFGYMPSGMPQMLLFQFGAKHAPMLELCCRCTINTPCSRSGSHLCLFCVAAFVSTPTLKTPEPFMLIPICLVMLSSIEAVTDLKQLHDSPCCHDFIDSCAYILAFSCPGPGLATDLFEAILTAVHSCLMPSDVCLTPYILHRKLPLRGKLALLKD